MVWATLIRVAGIVAGLVAGYAVAGADRHGLGQALAVPVFGACLLAGVFLGELALPRPPTSGVRSARLTPRRVRDYLPRFPSIVLAALGGALLVLLTITTATGSADDEGRPGRVLWFDCPPLDDGSQMSSGRGPWPGVYYSVPILLTVLATAVVAAVVLRAVVHRSHADGGDLSADGYRRRSASTVMATLGLVVAVPLAGSAVFAGSAVRGGACTPRIAELMAGPLFLVAFAAVLAIGYYVALLIVPPARGRVPAGRP